MMHRLALPFVAAVLLAGCEADGAGPLLAAERGCLACHGLVHKQVGPGFAQIAARYRGDAEAPARLAGKIRHGSVGAWGRVIMPAQTHVSEADAQALAAWVLAQPAPPP